MAQSERSGKHVSFAKENIASAYDVNSRSDYAHPPMTYKEWLKHKDVERRLKRKLITQAQDDVRQTLLEMANQENERE